MPHLKYAERYWRIASDELWLPGFCSLFGRSTWLIFLVIVVGISADKLAACPSGPYILLYLIISIVLLLITIINEGFIIRISIRGTMVENVQRDLTIPNYLTSRIILGCFQFLAAIFGCIIVSAHSAIPCANNFEINSSMGVDTIFLCIVLFSQIIESTILVCCMVIFASHSVHVGASESSDMYDNGRISSSSRDIWENRMKYLCSSIQVCSCNLFGNYYYFS